MTPWNQVYDPFGSQWLSTFVASLPVIALLGMIASGKIKVHIAAVLALVVAFLVAVVAFGMPTDLAVRATILGMVTGMFPIGWIILNVIFLYRLTVEKGWFAILQQSVAGITEDRRIQLLLVAFAFGAFFEGAGGFGTPVAVTGAILIGLGFSPLAASGLSLIANTAPVAYGALGAPVQGLASVTGYDPYVLGAMIGRQLPFFSVIVPFWLIWVFAGFRGMMAVWPPIAVCGISFAAAQFLISNYINPWIVDIGASLVSMAALVAFLKVWRPSQVWTSPALRGHDPSIGYGEPRPASLGAGVPGDLPKVHVGGRTASSQEILMAWVPWIILSIIVAIWGTGWFKGIVNPIFSWKYEVPGLHNMIMKVPPVEAAPKAEAAIFNFTYMSYTGTGVLFAAIISGLIMRFSPVRLVTAYFETIWVLRYSLITIAAMLALGVLTRYAGVDATLGLAFAGTGILYPFFGTLLGWLGVALTGSDTASNVLFGGLQRITSEQLGLSGILMASANSSGGVMGKMIDAQSIVVASTATGYFGQESKILRFVFWHSIVLACLVGGLVMLQAYVYPFTEMVIHPPAGLAPVAH
ncbi:lactate permease [Methylobacterium sp. DM1]|uniref:L-lactate permease n=1 Tax=Methylorubrum aminovorans TaxID=269069 RepID=A0ABQ4UJM3_9HYPH|nr:MULTISPECIES: L-lactate permease [Methylobacteriaceae]AWI90865.1 lactate permease [Methylobacterium sp. DM1]QIJ76813.1 L-lactate permease [Methylobacterium sp. CLZ]QIJ81716.1 L-lactate permease [Methylobacterium sp. NI91]GJE66315.1 Glycolate permease GlcA [Methylorubrum aminovorans]GMA75418.1 L-lactate permease [Methylorubrum aminovorans]